MTIIRIPKHSLVLLCGPAGSGKTTFARKYFPTSWILSTDDCRVMVADTTEGERYFNRQAFDLFFTWLDKRMELASTTVVDSTALSPRFREDVIRVGRFWQSEVHVVIIDTTEAVCQKWNTQRTRQVVPEVVARQYARFVQAKSEVEEEDFDGIHHVTPETDAETVVEVVPLPVEIDDPGPFDVVGDIHGCGEEFVEILGKLGWKKGNESYHHPAGRKLIFVGDLADRGPDPCGVWEIAVSMLESGRAYLAPGNHDVRFSNWIEGKDVRLNYGLDETVRIFAKEPPQRVEPLKKRILRAVQSSPAYLLLDGERLCVSHAGIKRPMIGRLSKKIRQFCLHGKSGERDSGERVVRNDWAEDYFGPTFVVYGHQVARKARIYHNTLNIDQGCAFGGALSALRYPEIKLVQVQARRIYCEESSSGPGHRTE
jgi:protein phosphatase